MHAQESSLLQHRSQRVQPIAQHMIRPRLISRIPHMFICQVISAESSKVSTIPDAFVVSCPDRCEATSAILDTGASRSVIGSKVLETLLRKLPQEVQNAVRKKPSSVKFRFGNNQTLTSKYCVYLPLYSVDASECLWLGVEVVEGQTPFLFSKRAFKQLGGILDTTQDRCTLKRLQKTIKLKVNATGLYLLDVSEFCIQPAAEAASQCHDFVGLIHHVDKSRGITSHGNKGKMFSFHHTGLQSADISCRNVPITMPTKSVARLRSTDDPLPVPETCSERSTVLESHAIRSERNSSGSQELGQSGHECSHHVAPSQYADDRGRDSAGFGRSDSTPGTDVWPTGPTEDFSSSTDQSTAGTYEHTTAPSRSSRDHKCNSLSPGDGPKESNEICTTQRCDEQESGCPKPHRWNSSSSRWRFNFRSPRAGRLWQFNRLGSHVRKLLGRTRAFRRTAGGRSSNKWTSHAPQCDTRQHLHSRVGTKDSHMGQEASRQDVCRSASSGSGLLQLEQRSIHEPSTHPAGVCGLLPSEVGD